MLNRIGTLRWADVRATTDWPWKAFLALGVVMAIGYFALPSADVQNIAYQVPETLAVLAVLAGIALQRPSDRRPWLILAGGLALTTAGDWTWLVLDALGQNPFPSIADVFYLAGVALIAAALWLLIRGRIPGGDRAGVLDALIVAVGVGLLSWVFLMAPIVADTTQSFGEVAVALAYPLMDILLLGGLARLFLTPGRHVAAVYLLIGALGTMLVADYVYAFLAVADSYHVGQLVDAGWLLSSAFFGAAALHPSMRQVAEPIEPGEIQFSWWRLALLAAASLMAPAVLVVQWIGGSTIDVPVIATGCVVLFLLVITRLGVLVTDLRATLGQQRVLEDELERRALSDPLTGLPNRIFFHERLEHALAQRGSQATVLFIDLDDFKTVNDAFGHDAGDTVLRSVAEAIRRAVRAGDTPARLGGDEFAVLIEDSPGAYEAGLAAERLLVAIQAPTKLANRDYVIGASIGISIGSGERSDAASLMREADIAMYVAKGQGKGRFTVFEHTVHAPVLRSLELRTDLEHGIKHREFEVHYQPIIELASGTLAGIEALVRWRHPRRGLLAPSEFIGLAESTGAIVPLGKWILTEACAEGVRWSGLGTAAHPFYVSVNLSAVQLAQSGFAEIVQEALAVTGLPVEQLVLETTESVRLDSDAALVALRELRRLGVRLAIDDFGTGYASLSQLRRIPFDILKIDRTFVAGLTPGSRAELLIGGIVDLARRLGIAVVAEGIETAEQLAQLRAMGCAYGQGFDFAEPMSALELAALLGRPPKAFRVNRSPDGAAPIDAPVAAPGTEPIAAPIAALGATGSRDRPAAARLVEPGSEPRRRVLVPGSMLRET